MGLRVSSSNTPAASPISPSDTMISGSCTRRSFRARSSPGSRGHSRSIWLLVQSATKLGLCCSPTEVPSAGVRQQMATGHAYDVVLLRTELERWKKCRDTGPKFHDSPFNRWTALRMHDAHDAGRMRPVSLPLTGRHFGLTRSILVHITSCASCRPRLSHPPTPRRTTLP